MKPSKIPAIDNLVNNTGGPIGPGAGNAEVGAIQDLLRGHGYRQMPGIRTPGRGSFGKKTRKAIADFRVKQGLPPGTVVDREVLLKLVQAPATEPIVSQAYVTLALDFDFTPMIKLVSLVSIVEGGGKFAALNLNTDRAGLSFGR